MTKHQQRIWLTYFVSFAFLVGFFSFSIFEVVKSQESHRHEATLKAQFEQLQTQVLSTPMTLTDLSIFMTQNRMLGQIYNEDFQLLPSYIYSNIDVTLTSKEIKTNTMINFKINVEGTTFYLPGILYPATFQNRTYYVLLLSKNIDSLDLLNHLKQVLFYGSALVIVAGILMSYFVSKKSMKPIYLSWKKQQQFTHDASHELRTPITVIMLKADKLLKHQDGIIEDHIEDVIAIKNEGRRMKKQVEDLLLLSRGDSGMLVLDVVQVSIEDEIMACFNVFEELVEVSGKKLLTELNFNPMLQIDVERFKQILMILLDNALKYTPDGGTIWIKTSKSGHRLKLDVINSSPPIEDKHLSHLFERFYQVDTSRSDQSSGLGLAIAKQLVLLHHGSIHVSNTDEGVCFTVYLNVIRNH